MTTSSSSSGLPFRSTSKRSDISPVEGFIPTLSVLNFGLAEFVDHELLSRLENYEQSLPDTEKETKEKVREMIQWLNEEIDAIEAYINSRSKIREPMRNNILNFLVKHATQLGLLLSQANINDVDHSQTNVETDVDQKSSNKTILERIDEPEDIVPVGAIAL